MTTDLKNGRESATQSSGKSADSKGISRCICPRTADSMVGLGRERRSPRLAQSHPFTHSTNKHTLSSCFYCVSGTALGSWAPEVTKMDIALSQNKQDRAGGRMRRSKQRPREVGPFKPVERNLEYPLEQGETTEGF